jgi:predicted DNA-binding transcriptional regulator AlpA
MPKTTKPGRKVAEVHGYLTAEELADLLRVSRHTIYRNEGVTMPAFHLVLGSKRFREDEIRAWQEAGEVWPIPASPDGRE